MVKNVEWLGHDCFKIKSENGTILYTDPYKIKNNEPADLILVTHDHYDHCSPEDIEKIRKPDTVIVTCTDCKQKLKGDVRAFRPDELTTIRDIEIETVPAYNIGKDFHPKSRGWLGFVFRVDQRRMYLAGDTDLIPEMGELNDIDIAFLPVSGTYVMTADEAARATDIINPKLAIPMHYGTIIGSRSDAERFKEQCRCDVEILG